MQYAPDELDDSMASLTNLKQTGTVYEYHKAFIKLAHLVEDTELREDLREKVRMDKLMTMVAAYISACAREMIALTEKRLAKL